MFVLLDEEKQILLVYQDTVPGPILEIHYLIDNDAFALIDFILSTNLIV